MNFDRSHPRQPATLVMTATITPPVGMPGTTRNDPAVRLQDYRQAFQCYLATSDRLIDQIVILENSDADLSQFAEIARAYGSKKRIHLVNTPSDYPSEKGKGYGEFFMMDWGLQKLRTDGAITDDTKIWKVTGRLNVRNITNVLETAPAQYDMYCDLRDVPLIGERLGGNKWMELRLFSLTLATYDALFRGRYGAGAVLEKEFFPIVDRVFRSKRLKVQPRSKRQPIFSGYGGLANANYDSAGYQLKNNIRRFGRLLFPWVWL